MLSFLILACGCFGQLDGSPYPSANICGTCPWTSLSTLGRDNSTGFLQILTRRPSKVGHQGITDFSRHLFGILTKITEGIVIGKEEPCRNSVGCIHGHHLKHRDYIKFSCVTFFVLVLLSISFPDKGLLCKLIACFFSVSFGCHLSA